MRTWIGLLLLGFAVLAYGWTSRHVPAITVENLSGVELASATFVVGSGTGTRADLGPAVGGGQTLPIRAEGKAHLELRFVDGTTARFDAGWFSPGTRHDVHVVVVSVDSVRVSSGDEGS